MKLRTRTVILALAAGLLLPVASSAATLSATPSTLTSVYSSASGGDTINLASGAYASFKGATKSSRIVVQAGSGATVTMAGAQFLGTANITLKGIKFTSGVVLRDGAHDNVLDGDVFDNLGPATWEGRVSLNLGATKNTIKNSHLGNGGCSDGVFVGDASGNTIGPGNEFSGIKQGSCSAHSDALQLYDGPQTTIVGNYFHDNSTGIMAPNGTSDATLTDNVFVMDSYPYAAYFGWSRNTTAVHNTITGGSLHFEDWTDPNNNDHPSTHTSGIVRDNVLLGGIDKVKIPAGALSQDYNLLPSGATGAHDLTGRPTFSGGASPITYAGFALASSSLGRADASDGLDRGVRFGTAPPTGDTTPPETTLTSGPVDSTSTSATVAFSSSESGSTFECRLDSGAWTSCVAPKQYDGLAVGSHVIAVRATDFAGNTDQSPATVSWTVQDAPQSCDQTAAERDQALADLATMTASRDSVQALANSYKARAEKAEDQLARIRAITGE